MNEPLTLGFEEITDDNESLYLQLCYRLGRPAYLDSVVKSGKGKKAYETLWTEAEHVRLLEAVLGAKGMSMVSGYTSPLYETMLEGAGWARADTVKPGRSKHMTERVESIWLHPRIGERLAGQLF